MARVDMVRFSCNYCGKVVGLSSSAIYPPGWKQFHARQTLPTENDQSFAADLCNEHSDNILDCLFGKSGPHRPQAKEIA